jgi:pimeloyl-ACP methyl ester carboxylesterase
VSFKATDGAMVYGTLRTPAQPNRPAMLLLHMWGSDRTSWDLFARAAASQGFMTLAIDLRGHGDARAAGANVVATAPESLVNDILEHDIGSAIDYLVDNGADPDNLVLVGASVGANLALAYASVDTRIQAVVLLSPGEEYRGVAVMPALDAYSHRPLMILATEGDSYSAQTAREMKSAAQSYCELRMYRGTAHGTDILVTIQSAINQIFLWLEPIIEPNSSAEETGATP